MKDKLLLFLMGMFFLPGLSYGFPLFESENLILYLEDYLRTDLITFKNVVDLDNKNSQDSTTYLGIDYSLAFNLEAKDQGPRYYLKLERNGPYDYDAPLAIHKRLTVAGPSQIKAYRNEELLPQAEEFWLDTPVAKTPLRFKAGLFSYEVGKGFAQGTGSFENYGLSICYPGENFSWRFHYFRPDLVYKKTLGPRIEQEKQEGIAYEPNSANYFAVDAAINCADLKLTPFAGLLLDNTSSGKRTNLFAAPVHREVLGTAGLDCDLKLKDFYLGLEAARNFGRAESTDDEFKDIEHAGYLFYLTASYAIKKFSPHSRFLFSSGNKVTTEMVDNGDEEFAGGSNKAFSAYSPLNINLFDSLGPIADSLPLVFFGWGYGLNYGLGINRPSTLADDAVLENLIMPSAGFDYQLTDKLSVTLDYWYILANERGVGSFEGVARELSRKLGQEIDLSFSYDINKQINLSLCGGYFLPGESFKEERDDTEGSLFTPFVRGDGQADPAYQIELAIEFQY